MTDPTDRRQHPRLRSTARILWCVVGASELQYDRLRDVSASGALVATESLPRAGDEIRFDLLDDGGEKIATGLAKVAWTRPGKGMGITFLALGIDTALLATLTAIADDPFPKRPPPLPGKKGGPPPMPVVPSLRPTADEADVVSEDDEIAPEIEPLAVKAAGVVIGIDLGTTNTCASYVVDGKPRIIPGRTGTSTIPSMITFEKDGTWHVGQRAADRQVLQPTRTVYGSKRLVGRTYRADLAEELQKYFAYPLGEADGQRFGVRIDGGVVSMETIAARVLAEVKQTAEEHLGERVEAAVVTVPAYFSEVQREAVRRAAREAGLVVHRILNEPTAAAVAYGHKQGQRKARVAVWDFGGGTFDFSLVDVTDGTIEVVATAGDNFVGGSDFDHRIAAHLLAEFQKKENLDLEPTPQQIARLREAAEAAKRSLSVQTEHLVELPELTSDGGKRSLSIEITRAQFEDMARPLVERTVAIAMQVLADRGVAPTAVDEVVLVGGSTRIPAVQRAVEKLFGKKPSKRINPDEAVALGAALVASDTGTAPALLDVLPMSVGRGVAGGRFEPIAPRNSRLPTQKEISIAADLLGSATVPLFQGESPALTDDEYLCSIVIEDPALRDGGHAVIRISFDEHCVMAIEARDAETGRALATTLDRNRPAADVLRELGAFQGSPPELPRRPESGLAKVFGRLAKLFGR